MKDSILEETVDQSIDSYFSRNDKRFFHHIHKMTAQNNCVIVIILDNYSLAD